VFLSEKFLKMNWVIGLGYTLNNFFFEKKTKLDFFRN